MPDDATATAGLARSLVLSGRPRRAIALFERALELGEQSGQLDADALIDLAHVLANEVKDLPQAIARLRQVSANSARIAEARYWEAQYCARLGDRVGATLAFARMREAVELSSEPPRSEWVAWLTQAAENSLAVDDDPFAAERHLAVALRLAPNVDEVGKRYREVAALAAQRARALRSP
jgi:tetratricopeptide (TPR) repeat protein